MNAVSTGPIGCGPVSWLRRVRLNVWFDLWSRCHAEVANVFGSGQESGRVRSAFFAPTSAVAVRSFGAALRGGDEVMKDHPEDFVLYHVGEFDQLNGSVTPKELPEQVVSGLDLVNSLIRKGDVS